MEGSADKVAGFALGALLDGDRDAAGVTGQVADAFHAEVRSRLTDVSRAEDKREAVAALIGKLRPQPRTLDGLPHSVRTLLEPARLKRSASKREQTPGVDPDLLAMLKRLAARLAEARPG